LGAWQKDRDKRDKVTYLRRLYTELGEKARGNNLIKSILKYIEFCDIIMAWSEHWASLPDLA